MMGPYCQFCGNRCFLIRTLPDDATGKFAGMTLSMATCPDGIDNDRRATGYSHRECVNPVTGKVHA